MSSPRREARTLAMQALCQWDVQRDESPQALDGFLTAEQPETRVADYARTLVMGYWQKRQSVDDRITAALIHWSLARISPVERNTMRVAVVELLSDVVPPRVALDEAIEIGRTFGGRDSPRFINGVLDKVLSRLEKSRKDS